MNVIDRFRGDYGFLSNFHGPRLSVEHRYQAAKAKYYEDYEKIIYADTASLAKKISKTIVMRDDWDDVKLVVMENLLREKFAEEPYKTKLLSTGNAMIIEGNDWGDTFWGVCNGSGSNHLGRLLMKIRDEFLVGQGIIEY